jgi:ABC-2 type transport system permease protein
MSQSIFQQKVDTPDHPSDQSNREMPLLKEAQEMSQETIALTRRLFIQLIRRPSTLIAGLIQPLMWLVLFGALFQNAPEGFLGGEYQQFLGAGVIVFTAFGGALNAGLPVMFDREFGFLNRLLMAPLVSRSSIVLASALFIMSLSLLQTVAIVATIAVMGSGLPNLSGMALIVSIVMLLVFAVTSVSLALAFTLKGHVELIAVILVTNLPLLFSSTALAPIAFMPTWLQWIALLNPLSYAIEPIRYVYSHTDWGFGSIVMAAPWGDVSILGCLGLLVMFAVGMLIGVKPLLGRSLG